MLIALDALSVRTQGRKAKTPDQLKIAELAQVAQPPAPNFFLDVDKFCQFEQVSFGDGFEDLSTLIFDNFSENQM